MSDFFNPYKLFKNHSQDTSYNYNSLHLNNLNEFLGLQHFLDSFNILNMCLMISCNYLKFLRFWHCFHFYTRYFSQLVMSSHQVKVLPLL